MFSIDFFSALLNSFVTMVLTCNPSFLSNNVLLTTVDLKILLMFVFDMEFDFLFLLIDD